MGLVKTVFDFFTCHVSASDMHEHVHTAVALNVRCQVESDITGDAARIPGNIDPERVSPAHTFDSVQEILYASLGLGREILKGVIVARLGYEACCSVGPWRVRW